MPRGYDCNVLAHGVPIRDGFPIDDAVRNLASNIVARIRASIIGYRIEVSGEFLKQTHIKRLGVIHIDIRASRVQVGVLRIKQLLCQLEHELFIGAR